MKQYLSVLAAGLLVASPSLADMIAASPGVTLTEAAQAKFNPTRAPRPAYHAGSRQLRHPGAALFVRGHERGRRMDARAGGGRKFDRDGQDQGALTNRSVESTVGLAYGMDRDYSKLAADARLSPEEAAGMSFDEIANAYLDMEH